MAVFSVFVAGTVSRAYEPETPNDLELTTATNETVSTNGGVYVLGLDEADLGGWERDVTIGAANPEPLHVVRGAGGGNELVVNTVLPEPAAIARLVRADREAWANGRAFRARIYVPADAGPYPAAQLLARHDVWGWFTTLPTRPLEPGKWTTVSWPLGHNSPDWEGLGRSIAWNDTIRRELAGVGLRVFFQSSAPEETRRKTRVSVRIADLAIEGVNEAPPPLTVVDLRAEKDETLCGERFEISFDLSRAYDNPFDPGQVAVDVDFLPPSGQKISLPAFYFQDFTRRRLADGTEACDPRGMACWKARFTPVEAGEYEYVVRVKDHDGEAFETPLRTFRATEAPFRGFVRRDANDKRYLAFDDGSFFYPIGLIIRSPWDARQQYQYEFEVRRDMGTYDYDKYFTAMAKSGLNFSRVWMAAWWTALEWTHGYRADYPGLARYNLENAWRQDYVIDLAQRLDIPFILTLHNHGQFATRRADPEWLDNPYSKVHGGPLTRADEFWTNEEARNLVRNRLRYIVGRWGYSPAIAVWELFNEVNLVDRYDSSTIAAWHRDMARYLRSIDPYRHLIATHFTIGKLDGKVAGLDEMDIAQSNAYSGDMIDGAGEMFRQAYPLNKPCLINEFGVGRSFPTLQHNYHAGLWISSVMPYCGAALFWWWPFVHEMNEYYELEAVVRFHIGEDYRGQNFQLAEIGVSDGARVVEAVGMKSSSKARIWLYDRRLYRSGSRFQPPQLPILPAGALRIPDVRLRLTGLAPGRYRIEFWDTWRGQIAEPPRLVDHSEGTMELAAPAFERDIACKVDRVEEAAPFSAADAGAGTDATDGGGNS